MVLKILFFHKKVISSKTIEFNLNLTCELRKLQTWIRQLQNSISNEAPEDAILHQKLKLIL